MKNCQAEEKPDGEKSDEDPKTKLPFIENMLKDQRTSRTLEDGVSLSNAKKKDIVKSLNDLLFEVWAEEEDPAKYYFQTVCSFQDYELLMQFVRRKKVLGILIITMLANVANLLIPEPMFTNEKNAIMEDKQYIASAGDALEHKAISQAMSSYLVNLLMAAMLFSLSFYVLFCSKCSFIGRNHGKYELIVALAAQYTIALCFVMFPNLFMFQFLVNTTILFTVVVKEAIKSDQQIMILLTNTFLINYIAIEGLRYYQKEAQASYAQNTDLYYSTLKTQYYQPGFEETSRAYLLAIVVYCLVVVQSQRINQSLIKMLVSKIQTLQQSLDIKDTYNASMIHELRNPLNAVLGAIGLLKYSRTLCKEDNETLNIASMSGEILITLINNALDGAKIEANKLELDPHKGDIVETLTKTASLFQWKAREKKINISLKIGKKIPALVEIDEARITQILVNIIGNAVKFTPEQGKIKVRARFISDDHQHASNTVKHKLNVMMKFGSVNSYLEDEEYEQKFFDNKELFMDMGHGSEENPDDDDRCEEIKADVTPGTETPHDYEMDSNTDKSQEPLFHIKNLNDNQQIITMNMMKNESFTSLNVAEYFEERKNRSKSNIGVRELDFKNSFLEWANCHHHEPQTQPTQRATQPQTSPINMTKITSQTLVRSEQPEDQQTQMMQAQSQQNFRLGPRNSVQAFSESLNRDASLSLESNFEDRNNYRTFTNSSSSNQVLPKRKNHQKSKFYQQLESDNLIDLSDDDVEHHHHHHHHHNLKNQDKEEEDADQSENLFRQNLQMLDFQALREEQGSIECKGQLIIEVIDSGIGISQEGIKKLFQPFQQADKSIQAKYGGTGLGLWITNKLVGLMRGKIEVTSELNKGTTFTIKIPVIGEYRDKTPSYEDDNTENTGQRCGGNQMASHSSSERRAPRMRMSQQNVRGEPTMEEFNVLLFQKDEIMTKLFKKYLQKHQIQFKFSTNFKDFLRSFRFQKYNACFIDIDINVTAEDLDKLVTFINALEPEDKNSFCKIFCLFCNPLPSLTLTARDIDKAKGKILQKNNIKTIKKPIQGYQISQILRRIKTRSDLVVLKNISKLENNQLFEDYSQRLPTFNRIGTCLVKNQQQSQCLMSKKNSGHSCNQETNNFQSNGMSSSLDQKNFDEPTFSKMNTNDVPLTQDSRMYKQSIVCKDDERQITQLLQSEVSKLQAEHSRNGELVLSNSSSQSSGNLNQGQQSSQMMQLKTNRQIERIKLDEGSRNEKEGSPRNFIRNNETPIQVNRFVEDRRAMQKRISSEMETLLVKNAKGQIKSPAKARDTFRFVNNLSDEEEEKKSSSWQINTPNFNNMSEQSQTTNRGHSSYKKEVDKDSSQYSLGRQPSAQFASTLPSGAVAAPNVAPNIKKQQSKRNLKPDLQSQPSSSTNRSKQTEESGNRQIVLVVDDNKMNQFIVQKMLEKVPLIIQNKIQLVAADDGEQAYQKFMKEQSKDKAIKLILMDCEMPILDGYEASKKIRDSEAANGFGSSLIIGLSGNQGEQHARKCKLAGMNDAITKPIVFDQLKSIVKRAIDNGNNTQGNMSGAESGRSRLQKSEHLPRQEGGLTSRRSQFRHREEDDEDDQDDEDFERKYKSHK